jgi:L-aminopeptidase/D-esterase-like protein
LPIVGETYDGQFNDIEGSHIQAEHVFQALDQARSGALLEGNVGGGTGMITYEYKGGTGTSSRRLSEQDGGYTVGVLVQSNYGERKHLRVGGIRMGEVLHEDMPRCLDASIPMVGIESRRDAKRVNARAEGSIIVIVATDAPLLPHQLKRLAKRPSLAIGRLGGLGAAGSGDIFLAFSTANADATDDRVPTAGSMHVEMHPNLALTSLFEAVIDASEEAILNALVAAEAGEGINRFYVPRLPHMAVRDQLVAHRLLEKRGLQRAVDGDLSS